jgi:hypothetical protein
LSFGIDLIVKDSSQRNSRQAQEANPSLDGRHRPAAKDNCGR